MLEGTDFRAGKYGTYDEYVEAQKVVTEEEKNKTENPSNEDEDLETNKVPLIGNYLRIIMQETDGNIVEKGNHEELMEQKGFYAELYNSQFEL